MSVIGDTAVQIATTIDNVTDSGIVYSYRPMPKESWDAFLTAFTVEIAGVRHIRAWTVQYMGEERQELNIAGTLLAKQRHTYVWKARFYLGWLDPATEVTFRNIVEAVANALDSNRTLGGLAISHHPVDVTIPNNGDGVLLGANLCHTAEIDFRSWGDINFTIS